MSDKFLREDATYQEIPSGTLFGEVTITAPGIIAAPFYSAIPTGPGVEIVPAPGPGLILVPSAALSIVTDGNPWFNGADPRLYWGDPATGVSSAFTSNIIQDNLSNPLAGGSYLSVQQKIFWTIDQGGIAFINKPPVLENQPLVLQSATDASNGGALIGTRSIRYIVYYTIQPAEAIAALYFSIVAVNQGTKTFTVSPDASALSGSVSVTGSTGNDGVYTVASATLQNTTYPITAVNTGTGTFTVAGDRTEQFKVGTFCVVTGSTGNDGSYNVAGSSFGGGNTDIVVAQAIPDPTADGSITDRLETDVIVVEAIPSATADGWMTS